MSEFCMKNWKILHTGFPNSTYTSSVRAHFKNNFSHKISNNLKFDLMYALGLWSNYYSQLSRQTIDERENHSSKRFIHFPVMNTLLNESHQSHAAIDNVSNEVQNSVQNIAEVKILC